MQEHLKTLLNKINNGEKFGVIRPSDGEHYILKNQTLT